MRYRILLEGEGATIAESWVSKDSDLRELVNDLEEGEANWDDEAEGLRDGTVIVEDEDGEVVLESHVDVDDYVDFEETPDYAEHPGEYHLRRFRAEEGRFFENWLETDAPLNPDLLTFGGISFPGVGGVINEVLYDGDTICTEDDPVVNWDSNGSVSCWEAADDDDGELEVEIPDGSEEEDADDSSGDFFAKTEDEMPAAVAKPEPEKAVDNAAPHAATFGEAWRAFWQRGGFRIAGRASRAEYWKAMLLVLGITVGLVVVGGILTRVANQFGFIVAMGAWCLWLLSILVPSITAQIRRLHDAGWSAWWVLLNLVKYKGIGPLVVLVLLCLPGKKEANKYGPVPGTGK